jgi:hypothetical protein
MCEVVQKLKHGDGLTDELDLPVASFFVLLFSYRLNPQLLSSCFSSSVDTAGNVNVTFPA